MSLDKCPNLECTREWHGLAYETAYYANWPGRVMYKACPGSHLFEETNKEKIS